MEFILSLYQHGSTKCGLCHRLVVTHTSIICSVYLPSIHSLLSPCGRQHRCYRQNSCYNLGLSILPEDMSTCRLQVLWSKLLTFWLVDYCSTESVMFHHHLSKVAQNTCSWEGFSRCCVLRPLWGRLRRGVFSWFHSATSLLDSAKSYTLDLKQSITESWYVWTQTHSFELTACVYDIANSWQGEGSLSKAVRDNNLPFDPCTSSSQHRAVYILGAVALPQCRSIGIRFVDPLGLPIQSSMEREDPERTKLRTQSYTLLLQQYHTLLCLLHSQGRQRMSQFTSTLKLFTYLRPERCFSFICPVSTLCVCVCVCVCVWVSVCVSVVTRFTED